MNVLEFIKQNKQIVALVIVALVLFPFALIELRPTPSSHDIQTQVKTVTPSVVATVPPTVFTAPTITVTPEINDPQKKLLDMVQNRRPLSQADQQAKQLILSKLPNGQDSGELYKTGDISIEYVHSPDLFQVDILTTNVLSDKTEAVIWFKQNGMSQDGICRLPLTFYLDFQIKNQVTSPINPLPEGC